MVVVWTTYAALKQGPRQWNMTIIHIYDILLLVTFSYINKRARSQIDCLDLVIDVRLIYFLISASCQAVNSQLYSIWYSAVYCGGVWSLLSIIISWKSCWWLQILYCCLLKPSQWILWVLASTTFPSLAPVFPQITSSLLPPPCCRYRGEREMGWAPARQEHKHLPGTPRLGQTGEDNTGINISTSCI